MPDAKDEALAAIADEALKLLNATDIGAAQRLGELILSIARHGVDVRTDAERAAK